MSKSVLVPLDGSKRSETILPALDAVCASGDKIVLISVGSPSKPQQVGVEQSGDVLLSSSNLGMGSTFATPHEEPVYAESGGQALQRATAEIGDYLADRAADLTKKGFTVKTEVIIGAHPAESIIHFAETMHPTLIAMASHSRNAIGGLILQQRRGGRAAQRRRSRSPGSDEGSSRQRRYRALDRNLFADSCGYGRLVGCRTPKQRSGSDRFGQPRSPAGPVTAVTARIAPSPVS